MIHFGKGRLFQSSVDNNQNMLVNFVCLMIVFIGLLVVEGNQVKAASIEFSEKESGFDEERKGEFTKNFVNQELENMIRGFQQSDILESPQVRSSKLIKEGQHYLRIGEKEQGLKLLLRAWEADINQYRIGVFICTSYLQDKKYDKALATAKKLQSALPGNTIGYKLEGMVYATQNEFEKAKSAFKKVLELRPGTPDASHNLAAFAIDEGDTDTARILYQSVLEYNPGFFRTVELLAKLEFETGHPKEVITLLEKPVKNNPKQLNIHILLGKAYIVTGDNIRSFSITESALSRFPDNPQLLEVIGIARFNTGSPDKAVDALTSAVQKKTGNITAHYYLAKSYEQLKQYPRAIEEVNTVLELNSEHSLAIFLKARLMARTQRYDQALELIHSLQKKYPKKSNLIEFEAKIALAQKRNKDAVKLLKKAVQLNETNYLIIQLAMVQMGTGDKQGAYTTLNNWLEKHPEDTSVRVVLADSFYYQRDFDSAKKQYLEILKFEPNTLVAHNNLARIWRKKGNLEEAYKHASKAYDLAPKNALILDTLSSILLKKNQPEQAISLFNEAILDSSNDPQMHYYLAKLLSQTGKVKQAKQHLKIALSLSSRFMERKQAQNLLQELQKN